MNDAAPNLGSDKNHKIINKGIAYSTRLLASREYSKIGLTKKLFEKGYSKTQANEVLDYLLENNWQSDERFCESFIRSKINKGCGEQRIRFELAQHNLSQHLIDKAFEMQSEDWQALCDKVCEKKARSIDWTEALKAKQKIERFLKYRGFSGSQIQKAIYKNLPKQETSGE